MTSTLSRLLSGRAAAESKIFDIARKDAAGKLNGAAKGLDDDLRHANMSHQDYSDKVEFYVRVHELEQQAGKLADAERAAGKARKAVEDFDAETVRLKEQRQAQRAQLVQAEQERLAAVRQAQRARGELQILELRHPFEMGLDAPVDLSLVTPSMNDERSGSYDPDAPVRIVDRETFDSEMRRRHRIMERARERIMSEHQQAVAAWEASKTSRMSGLRMTDRPAPTMAPICWKECVRRGWHREGIT